VATVSGGGTTEKYKFIQRYRQTLGIKYLCDWLKVSRSGYYAWRKRAQSKRTLSDQSLLKKIRKIHLDSRSVYGSPRVHQALKQQGIYVGKKRVERLMRAYDIKGRIVKVTRRQPGLKRFVARGENLRLKAPEASNINQIWVGDITYLKVDKRYQFLIVIMDIYSRKILGWRLSTSRTTKDTVSVLKRVVKHRQPEQEIIFHSDRGIEYTGHHYRDALKKNDIKPSVNRLGKCTDNGHMESFFHSLKAELIRGSTFKTGSELRASLSSYINHFYNTKRLHSGIGYHSPIEYEKLIAN
jgi:transposase InsO family protein